MLYDASSTGSQNYMNLVSEILNLNGYKYEENSAIIKTNIYRRK